MEALNWNKILISGSDEIYANAVSQSLKGQGFMDVEISGGGDPLAKCLEKRPSTCVFLYDQHPDSYDDLLLVKYSNPEVYLVVVAEQSLENAPEVLRHNVFEYIQKTDDTLEQLSSTMEVVASQVAMSENKRQKKHTLYVKITFAVSILLVVVMALLFSK